MVSVYPCNIYDLYDTVMARLRLETKAYRLLLRRHIFAPKLPSGMTYDFAIFVQYFLQPRPQALCSGKEEPGYEVVFFTACEYLVVISVSSLWSTLSQ